MSNCFEIIPLDTWFFRGSTPMESGMMNVVSIFPPPVSVIKGALWTAYCDEKRNSDYGDGTIPFEVTAIAIKKECQDGKSRLYMPAPAIWYYDSEKKISAGEKLEGVKKRVAMMLHASDTFNFKTSAGNVIYTSSENEPVSLNGAWVSSDFLENPKETFDCYSILFQNDIYTTELRTNVSLDVNRAAKKGQLFSSSHIRLLPGISLVVLINENLDLPDEGKFYFGGEKRISSYRKCVFPYINPKTTTDVYYVSPVPVEATDETLATLVASGKIYVTAGWDFKKRFHKPTTNWLPAGAVFTKQIHDYCVPLAQI